MPTKFRRPVGLSIAAATLLTAGYIIGEAGQPAPLAAQQKQLVLPASANMPAPEPAKRVVAYVYGNVPITREEFGDYLIDLYGAQRLELYVNKRLIEMACAKKGIDVTPIEIDAAIEDDCKRINISKADWIKNVLKQRYGKSIDEWRQDVMKPRLMLAKLCRDQIPVTDEELKQMYENRYGEKAKVKIILWPKEQSDIALKMYGHLRGSGTAQNPDAAWDEVATKQPDATLAARAGEIEPIGRYSGSESAKVEEIAFGLKEGDVSRIIELPIGWLVVKRTGTVPAQDVPFEKVKAELYKEVVDRKLTAEIPKVFAKIKEEAKPLLLNNRVDVPTPDAVPPAPQK